MVLKKPEVGIIASGLGLFLVSGYFFLFDTDAVFRMLGLDRLERRPKIAEVEVIRNMVRRKEFEMPEFRSVLVRQDVRVKDSVMTGTDSVAVLHFVDGTIIELGADALVQLETKGSSDSLGNLQLIVDVKKGEVKSAGPVKSLKVVKNGAPVAVKEVTKDSPAVTVAKAISEGKPIQRSNHCEAPSVDRKGDRFDVRMNCPGAIGEQRVRILDASGALVALKTIPIAPNLPAKLDWVAPKPGTFSIEMDQEKPLKTSLVVPERLQKLKWAPEPIRCGKSLAYEPSGKAVSAVIESEEGKMLWEVPKGLSLLEASALIPAPARLKVVETLADGFKWETPVLDLSRWRTCPILTQPVDGTSERVNALLGNLFTWTAISVEDRFVFELAEDREFTRIVFTQETPMNLIRFKPPIRGEAYWRVKDIGSGEYSNVNRVVLR